MGYELGSDSRCSSAVALWRTAAAPSTCCAAARGAAAAVGRQQAAYRRCLDALELERKARQHVAPRWRGAHLQALYGEDTGRCKLLRSLQNVSSSCGLDVVHACGAWGREGGGGGAAGGAVAMQWDDCCCCVSECPVAALLPRYQCRHP
eukprot:356865-Chlamydomonas_euryale.AAC.6